MPKKKLLKHKKEELFVYLSQKAKARAKTHGRKEFGSASAYVNKLILADIRIPLLDEGRETV